MNRLLSIIVITASVLFAGDEWMSAGKDIAYPQELYFVGVGMSERSQDAAKAMAMIEVRKQISVTVKASMLDEQFSLVGDGRERAGSKTESRARLTTSGEVQGIEVVKTGTKGRVFYALAVLDKKNFESNCRAAISEAQKELITLVEGAKADIGKARTGGALRKLSAAKKAIATILDQRKLLSAAATVTEAEKLPYTQTDIAQLYEKCVANLRMAKSGGDEQSFAVGMVPSEPFIVTITAGELPAPGIPVKLREGRKTILTRYTDDEGVAEFVLGENAEMAAGTHSYTASIALPVSASLRKMLKAQDQEFSYTVESNPCYAKIVVEVGKNLAAGKKEIVKKITASLSKYDLKDDPSADMTLFVDVSANETDNVQGLSENNTFVRTNVTLVMALKDENGRELGSLTGKGTGMGSTLVKSAAGGAAKVKIAKDLKALLEKVCAGAAPAGPRLKIAVFEFKNRGGHYGSWFEMAQSLSDMMITKLINTGKVDVVERTQIRRIMEEKSLAQSGLVEEADALTIARLAGADIFLIGSAGVTSGKIEADARLVDMKTGIAKCAMSSGTYAASDLRAVADDLVGQLKGKCLK